MRGSLLRCSSPAHAFPDDAARPRAEEKTKLFGPCSRDGIGRIDARLGPLAATDVHPDPTRSEPAELVPHPRHVGGGSVSRHRHLELRAGPRPQGVLGEGLRDVRREPAHTLEAAAPLAHPREDPRPYERRGLCSSRFGLEALEDKGQRRVEQVSVGAYPVEDPFGHHDTELGLERDGQLDQVDRIGCQVVRQGHVRRKLSDTHAEKVSDETPNTRLHKRVRTRTTSGPPAGSKRSSTVRIGFFGEMPI